MARRGEERWRGLPPVITGALARLQVCGGCKGEPIRKGHLALDQVTVTTWGRAPCGEWWCSDCLALRVHDAAPAYDFADIVCGALVLAVPIDCNGKMHMIKDFFFTTFVGAKRVPVKRCAAFMKSLQGCLLNYPRMRNM